MHAGKHHNGGAVLVVMEHGDVELVDQTALDLEAARRGDVLEVDAAEAGGEAFDGLDDLVDVLGIKAQAGRRSRRRRS